MNSLKKAKDFVVAGMENLNSFMNDHAGQVVMQIAKKVSIILAAGTLAFTLTAPIAHSASADQFNRDGENQQFDATRNVENGGYYSYNQDATLAKLKAAQVAMISLKRDVNQMNNGGGNSADRGFQEQLRASYNNYIDAANALMADVDQARGHGQNTKLIDGSLNNLSRDGEKIMPQIQAFFDSVQQANGRVVTRRDLNTPRSDAFESSRYGTPAANPQRYQ